MRLKRFGIVFAAVMAYGATAPGVLAVDLSGAYLGGNFGRARTSYDTGFIDGQIDSAAANGGDTLDITATSIDKMSNAWWVNTEFILRQYIEEQFEPAGRRRRRVHHGRALVGQTGLPARQSNRR